MTFVLLDDFMTLKKAKNLSKLSTSKSASKKSKTKSKSFVVSIIGYYGAVTNGIGCRCGGTGVQCHLATLYPFVPD